MLLEDFIVYKNQFLANALLSCLCDKLGYSLIDSRLLSIPLRKLTNFEKAEILKNCDYGKFNQNFQLSSLSRLGDYFEKDTIQSEDYSTLSDSIYDFPVEEFIEACNYFSSSIAQEQSLNGDIFSELGTNVGNLSVDKLVASLKDSSSLSNTMNVVSNTNAEMAKPSNDAENNANATITTSALANN